MAHGRRPRAVLAVFLILTLGTSACASRRSAADIERAAGAGESTVVSADGSPAEPGSIIAGAPDGTEPVATAGPSGPSGSPKAAVTRSGGRAAAPAQSTDPTSGQPALALPPRGAPVRIGVVGTMSGVGGTQRASVAAIQAWARYTNERGGLNGHPVEVLVVDDGNDPARLRASVQQLVEQRGVVAFVGLLGAFTLTKGAVDYLEAKQIPVVGGDRLSSFWQESPVMFPQASAAAALIWLHMVNTARLAGKGAAIGWVSCQEAQVCKDADRLWQPNAAQLGLDVKYRAQVSVAQPSFTSECLRAQRAGVEWFLLATDANSIRRIAASCDQQGYHPRYAVLQTSDEMTQLKALDGGYFGASTFPWVSDNTPATSEFQRVMKRYAPEVELSGHASSGWTAAKLFEKVAANIGATPTSNDIMSGLWKIKDDTLGGLTSPLTFIRGKPAPPRYCYFPMELRKSAWVSTGGVDPICQPPT